MNCRPNDLDCFLRRCEACDVWRRVALLCVILAGLIELYAMWSANESPHRKSLPVITDDYEVLEPQ